MRYNIPVIRSLVREKASHATEEKTVDQKMRDRLLLIASIGLTAAGIIFLCLSIFTEPKNNVYLCAALGTILLANLFNLLRYGKRGR